MATFTISLVVGAQTFTYTRTRSDENAQRIGPAYKKLLGLPENATNEEIWNALGAGIADGIEANVLTQERQDQQVAVVVPPMT